MLSSRTRVKFSSVGRKPPRMSSLVIPWAERDIPEPKTLSTELGANGPAEKFEALTKLAAEYAGAAPLAIPHRSKAKRSRARKITWYYYMLNTDDSSNSVCSYLRSMLYPRRGTKDKRIQNSYLRLLRQVGGTSPGQRLRSGGGERCEHRRVPAEVWRSGHAEVVPYRGGRRILDRGARSRTRNPAAAQERGEGERPGRSGNAVGLAGHGRRPKRCL